jgi:PAS domain S-box-containing protein
MGIKCPTGEEVAAGLRVEGQPLTAPDGTVLAESERQFRLLVQGVTDYAIYMLDAEGRIASWNAGGERIKGYLADEIIGKHFSCFYTEEDLAIGEPARALDAARNEGKYEKEGLRVRKDGTRFWASVVIDPVYDAGKLIGFAKITRDVSERKRAEESLQAAQQAMMQAQKMEAIGQLTYGVAHDFNNLLTVISNSLDLMVVDGSDAQRVRRLALGAQRAADRGALLTRQLLAFSRRQTLNPAPSDINDLIYAVEGLLRRAAGESVDIEMNLARHLGQSNVDSGEFEAALLNLIVNARDAMEGSGGGRICIRSGEREVLETVDGLAPGRYVFVSVEDNGSGMSEDVLTRAMEPFFTTKEVGKGSGLGLSQVYGFAAQSGGAATIESVHGQGTVVSINLPISREAASSANDEHAIAKVLLVEDDSDLQMVMVEALRFLGYVVLTANEGNAALEILRRDPGIDILFSDVVMPKGMSGVELMEHARALRPELKVILASGYARGQLPTIPAGCEYLPKPYRIDDVDSRLRKLMLPA